MTYFYDFSMFSQNSVRFPIKHAAGICQMNNKLVKRQEAGLNIQVYQELAIIWIIMKYQVQNNKNELGN